MSLHLVCYSTNDLLFGVIAVHILIVLVHRNKYLENRQFLGAYVLVCVVFQQNWCDVQPARLV